METRRLFLAILLSLAVLIAWQYLVGPPPPPPVEEAPHTPPATTSEVPGPEPEATRLPPEAPPAAPPEAEWIAAAAEERIQVETDDLRAELTNRGAQLVSMELKEHRTAEGEVLDLVRRRREGPFPFALVALGEGERRSHPLNEVLFNVERVGETEVAFRYAGPDGSAEKRFRFRADGLLEVEVAVPGRDDWGILLGPGLRNPSVKELESRFERRAAVYRTGSEMERLDTTGAEGSAAVPGANLAWAGLEDRYFLTVLIPVGGGRPVASAVFEPVLVVPGDDGGDARFEPLPAALTREQEDLLREYQLVVEPTGDRLTALSYWGAKQLERLSALPGDLDETIDLGIFRIIADPLLRGLHWIYNNVVANYGWAIVLMTLIIKIVLLPLTHKSYTSMRKMQELHPKMQAIRAKYRGKLKTKEGRPNLEAQRKMNEETMALYKSEGVNPASGCLPMLLQMPVLFAFYYILQAAVELRHAPWMLWIDDLSAPDPIYALPIIMGATQFLQQKMTPASGDPMQRRIFQLMPIFMTVLFLGFPSGLVLYWLTNNVLTIAQQWIYNHLKGRKSSTTEDSGRGARDKKTGRTLAR